MNSVDQLSTPTTIQVSCLGVLMLVKEEVIVVDIINIMDDTAKTKPRIYSTPLCCSRESVVVGFLLLPSKFSCLTSPEED